MDSPHLTLSQVLIFTQPEPANLRHNPNELDSHCLKKTFVLLPVTSFKLWYPTATLEGLLVSEG